MTSAGEPNQEAIEAWNSVLFEKFSRFRWLVTEGLGKHGTVAIERHVPHTARRVLDIGCGFGDATIELARWLGDAGQVRGVDAARRFVESARADVREAGIKNADFECVDVQVGNLGGPYDVAFSRFGTMFFANPVQALRNVHSSLADGGKLCMVVWRRREDNAWLHVAEKIVREIVPEPDKKEQQVTCGPGPFSMASADLVSDLLLKARFRDVAFERFDHSICIGKNLDNALEFAFALGPAGEVLRLAGDDAEHLRPRLESVLREALSQFARPDGVFAPSSTWFVTARPG